MSENSLFGGLDLESAADDPFHVDPGTYDAIVSDVSVGPTQKGDKVGMFIKYTIQGGEMDGRSVSEWKHIPTPGSEDPKDQRAAAFLKQRLLNLGIPESRMNSLTADDLMGIEVTIAVKQNNEYTNVAKVTLREEGASSPGGFAGFGN